MSELSQHAKLIKAIEIAKGAQVGIELSYFDVLEVAGELNEAKEVVAMLNARIAELEEENDRLQSAWFVEETICPDGSLKPKVSTLLSRIAELEAENTALKQHPQPIEFWSDEKKELYRRNESRTIKSGREEEREE